MFWIQDPHELGALQFDVHYAVNGGQFLGIGVDVQCHVSADLDGRILAAFNDFDTGSVLSVGLVTTAGFHGPIDLVQCEFELPVDGSNLDTGFSVYVTDASSLQSETMTPVPRIGYRLQRS